MEAPKTITEWFGKDIETLSREELVIALRYLSQAYEEALARPNAIHDMHVSVRLPRGDDDLPAVSLW